MTLPNDDCLVVQARVIFLSGEEKHIEVGVSKTVDDIQPQLRGLRDIPETHVYNVLVEDKLLAGDEKVAEAIDGVGFITVVANELFTYCREGYYEHTDLENTKMPTTVREACHKASGMRHCVAFCRDAASGEVYYVKRKGKRIRDNGASGWEWYDKVVESPPERPQTADEYHTTLESEAAEEE
eukprot:TRINITY_DN51536_c1_g1_i4.p1 TRINITY_DN51536_c1_g1~~TRINITY_DN51536_c1_g1_i4.p1  ORF type:complete len:183 (-),score=34.51 TRINITY_DN51536_c1_g1_i4:445-993(-)